MNYSIKKVLFSFLIVAVFSFSVTPAIGGATTHASTSQSDVDAVILNAVTYLQTEQNVDGGIRWVDEGSSVPATIRVVLAIAAAGYPQEMLVSEQGKRPIDYLAEEGYDWVFQSDGADPAVNIARAGQLLTSVAAANQDPYAFGAETINLVHLILTHYDTNTGVYGDATPGNVTDQVWAILGLAAAYASIPPEAVNWLASAQFTDGSWDDGFGSTLDMTPLALMALIASGHKTQDASEVVQAIDFMAAHQEPDGGWQTTWDSTTNANTTGMMLQAIYSAGQSPADPTWSRDAGSPLTALLSLAREDGAIGGDFTNAYSTADAILGLAGQPLYNLGQLRKIGQAFEFIFAAQEPDGGWGTVGQTLDAVITAHAAGWDPNTLARNGHNPLAYISDHIAAYLEAGPDAIGKTIMGLVAAGQDPTDFHGVDLVNTLMDTYDSENHAFGDPANTWHQALAILGLSAAQAAIPEGAVQTLIDLQREDGGWEYSTGFGTWPDNTSLALQALLATGLSRDGIVIENGLRHIQSHQLEDGGWGDSSTSAYALMALNALEMDPILWQNELNKTPINNLFTYQLPSGAFKFSDDFPDENMLATSAAFLAAVGGDYLFDSFEYGAENTAGLVVQTDQGEVTTACVTFEGDSISGLALLDASGIPYQSQDGFMNSILDISNPQGGTMYWSYWHWDGREWIFNNTGAGDSLVLPGTIEAWHFTSWEIFPSLPPDFIPHLDSMCEQNVLKNYAVQPFLHFYDLNKVPPTMTGVRTLEPAGQPQEASLTPIDEITTEEGLPLAPIIIIGAVGLIVLALIFWMLFRKK